MSVTRVCRRRDTCSHLRRRFDDDDGELLQAADRVDTEARSFKFFELVSD